MSYTRNPQWKDHPDTSTPITATALENIEAGIEGAHTELDLKVDVADAVSLETSTPPATGVSGTAGTANTAARGDHTHAQRFVLKYPIGQTVSGAGVWSGPLGLMDSQNVGNFDAPLSPFPVPRPFTLTALALRINTAGDAGSWSVAIYPSNAAGLPEGAPVYTSPDQAGVTAGVKTITGLSVALTDELYWIAFGQKGYTTTRPIPAGSNSSAYLGSVWTPTIGSTASDGHGLWVPGYDKTTGAWPTIAASAAFPAGRNQWSAWVYQVQGTLL